MHLRLPDVRVRHAVAAGLVDLQEGPRNHQSESWLQEVTGRVRAQAKVDACRQKASNGREKDEHGSNFTS